uniref:Uncharacterized protein n=1 Tax=Ananas comosus var. bracteatus TaxID=296719 RepID=A0A6V7PK30_ANACO|nr:unnamed protein product [Ananas comosus var. bracteatus]
MRHYSNQLTCGQSWPNCWKHLPGLPVLAFVWTTSPAIDHTLSSMMMHAIMAMLEDSLISRLGHFSRSSRLCRSRGIPCCQGLALRVAWAVSDFWAPLGLTVGPVRRFGVRLCRGHITCCLIELDRDTLHTRLGSAHECHSGDGLCAFADGCVHSPRDGYAYSPDWIGSDLTFPTVEPQVSAAAPSADQDRGKGVAS